MNDLDTKLSESIVTGFLYGIESNLLSDDVVEHRVAGFRHTKGYKEAMSHAKQAFIDAGWFTPSDTELVQQIMDFRAQAMQHTYVGPDTILPYTNRSTEELEAISKEWNKPRMTGQEWYDKFSSEYLREAILTNEHTYSSAYSAAKKAARIE